MKGRAGVVRVPCNQVAAHLLLSLLRHITRALTAIAQGWQLNHNQYGLLIGDECVDGFL